jgi:hypothetical protein
MVKLDFPNVATTNFSAVVQPNSGHGINLHYNATGAYDVINTFLNSRGLMSSWVVEKQRGENRYEPYAYAWKQQLEPLEPDI